MRCARLQLRFQPTALWSRPMRHISRHFHTVENATNPPTLPKSLMFWRIRAAILLTKLRHGLRRIVSGFSARCQACWPHDANLHYFGLRLVHGCPAGRVGLGFVRSRQSKEPAAALLTVGRTQERAGAPDTRAGRLL